MMKAAVDAGRGDEQLPVMFDFLKKYGLSVRIVCHLLTASTNRY
jgi:hypothetical protein